MIKIISLYFLSALLSFSIVAPSFAVLIEDNGDIEVIKDAEDENSNEETKNDLEEFEKYVEQLSNFEPQESLIVYSFNSYYYSISTNYIIDVHSPPPDQFT